MKLRKDLFWLGHTKTTQAYYLSNHRYSLFHSKKSTFLIKIKCPQAKGRAIDYHLIGTSIHLSAIVKLNMIDAVTDNFGMIDAYRKIGLHRTEYLVPSSNHIIGSHRRMVTDLLKINRASVDPVLYCLP